MIKLMKKEGENQLFITGMEYNSYYGILLGLILISLYRKFFQFHLYVEILKE